MYEEYEETIDIETDNSNSEQRIDNSDIEKEEQYKNEWNDDMGNNECCMACINKGNKF